jgi:hypothetical protein
MGILKILDLLINHMIITLRDEFKHKNIGGISILPC